LSEDARKKIVEGQHCQTKDTLLHGFIRDNNRRVTVFLLWFGADPHCYNNQYETPAGMIRTLAAALPRQHFEILTKSKALNTDGTPIKRLRRQLNQSLKILKHEVITDSNAALSNQFSFVATCYLASSAIRSNVKHISERHALNKQPKDIFQVLTEQLKLDDNSIIPLSYTSKHCHQKTKHFVARQNFVTSLSPLCALFSLDDCFKNINRAKFFDVNCHLVTIFESGTKAKRSSAMAAKALKAIDGNPLVDFALCYYYAYVKADRETTYKYAKKLQEQNYPIGYLMLRTSNNNLKLVVKAIDRNLSDRDSAPNHSKNTVTRRLLSRINPCSRVSFVWQCCPSTIFLRASSDNELR